MATFGSCALWTYWAVAIADDPFTAVSCGTGATAGALQLVLLALFHPSSPTRVAPKEKAD